MEGEINSSLRNFIETPKYLFKCCGKTFLHLELSSSCTANQYPFAKIFLCRLNDHKIYHKIETTRNYLSLIRHFSMNLSGSTSAVTLWEWRQTTTPVCIIVSSPQLVETVTTCNVYICTCTCTCILVLYNFWWLT